MKYFTKSFLYYQQGNKSLIIEHTVNFALSGNSHGLCNVELYRLNGIYTGTKPRDTNLLAMLKFLKKQGFHELLLCNYSFTIISLIFKLFSLETLCKEC